MAKIKKKVDLSVKIGSLSLKNPVILASGTAGSGREILEFFDMNKIGAIITKTVTLNKREGNPPPRIAEVPQGLLNSIGLDNDGVKEFIIREIPFLMKLKIPVIVSIAGDTPDEFVSIARELSRQKCIKALEVNFSCPNISHKLTRFSILSQDKKLCGRIIAHLRKVTGIPLVAKLSPNVTDIAEIAKELENNGIDAISLINTYPAMAIDIKTRKSRIASITGGLSGPCIKPIALKCVWDVYNAVDVPVIGIGGIMTGKDAIEFFLCGASAVQIGTANFINPTASLEVLDEVKRYLLENRIYTLKGLIGKLEV